MRKNSGTPNPPRVPAHHRESKLLGRVEMVELSRISEDSKYAVNTRKEVPQSEIDDMAASIDQYGQLEPIPVLEASDGTLHRAAGMCRMAALRKLGRTSVKAQILAPKDLGVSTDEQASAVLRGLESSRRKVPFSEKIKSLRQMCVARLTDEQIARAVLWGDVVVDRMKKIDDALREKYPSWEDHAAMNFDVAQALFSYPDIPATYRYLVEQGQLPKARASLSRGGKAASTKKLLDGLIKSHPWIAHLPWDNAAIELKLSTKKAVEWELWAREFEATFGLAPQEPAEVDGEPSV